MNHGGHGGHRGFMNEGELTGSVIESAMNMHASLGLGLLKSGFDVCFSYEHKDKGRLTTEDTEDTEVL